MGRAPRSPPGAPLAPPEGGGRERGSPAPPPCSHWPTPGRPPAGIGGCLVRCSARAHGRGAAAGARLPPCRGGCTSEGGERGRRVPVRSGPVRSGPCVCRAGPVRTAAGSACVRPLGAVPASGGRAAGRAEVTSLETRSLRRPVSVLADADCRGRSRGWGVRAGLPSAGQRQNGGRSAPVWPGRCELPAKPVRPRSFCQETGCRLCCSFRYHLQKKPKFIMPSSE